VAKNILSILRRQRALLDRAIQALERIQETRFAVPRDSKDAAVRQAGAKVSFLRKELDRDELDRPSPLPPGNDFGNE
jgi:hypothetical protein